MTTRRIRQSALLGIFLVALVGTALRTEAHSRKRFRADLQTTSRLVAAPAGRCSDTPGHAPSRGTARGRRSGGRHLPWPCDRRTVALCSHGRLLLRRPVQTDESQRPRDQGTVFRAPGAHLQFDTPTTGSRGSLAHQRERLHQRGQCRRYRKRLCGPSLRASARHHQPIHRRRDDFSRPNDRDRLTAAA